MVGPEDTGRTSNGTGAWVSGLMRVRPPSGVAAPNPAESPKSLRIVRKIVQANAGPGPNDGLRRQAP